jgi:hypothetical protein
MTIARIRPAWWIAIAAVAIVSSGAVALAGGIKITVQKAKEYQYENRRTWAWHPEESASVKVLQAVGDPEKIKGLMDPMIRPTVEQELAKRGFTQAPSDKADFHVCYYLLIGPKYSSQYQGQFLPAVPEWGIPDFVQSTTALKVIEQGSLVVDVISTELKAVIWRGVAATEIDGRISQAERQERITKGVSGMLKDFPPKDKKGD